MKVDWSLMRQILFAVESLPDGIAGLDLAASFPGYDPARVLHHLVLLSEGEFVRGAINETPEHTARHVCRLTWQGADLADLIRHDEVWESILRFIRLAGVDPSHAMITGVGRRLVQRMANSITGRV